MNGHQEIHREERRGISITMIIIAMLLPLLVLFLLPFGVSPVWFWIALALSVAVLFAVSALTILQRRTEAEPGLRMLFPDEQPDAVREIMDVSLAVEDDDIRIFRGRLLEPADKAYEKLKAAFHGEVLPLIQRDKRLGASVTLLPRDEAARIEKPIRLWKHWLLFALTFVTTTFAGALYQGANLVENPGAFLVGLPYSVGILGILGVHEMGHYIAAKRHGMKVTPPYFIPVPFALGTFGAFIRLRSPSENRRALFDVAVSGPFAGLVVAIVALWLGLKTSTVMPTQQDFFTGMFGSPFLFTLLAKLSFGNALQPGDAIRLSPLGFAGWLGFLITALNLLPIGQLDGGHTARAMFGHRIGSAIGITAMTILILLAIFVFPQLMLWAVIVFFIARRTAPPLNDVTPLGAGRFWLGCLAFVVLAMILLPFPHFLWR